MSLVEVKMRVFAYLLFVVLILTASDSEAAVINNLRAGTYADKTRIVLDLLMSKSRCEKSKV